MAVKIIRVYVQGKAKVTTNTPGVQIIVLKPGEAVPKATVG